MKGHIALAMLEKLEEAACTTFDLFDVFLSAGYGASYGKLSYMLSQRQRARAHAAVQRESERRLRERYYNVLSRLRRDGLIEEKKHRNKIIVLLTPQGRRKLEQLKKYEQLPSSTRYRREVASRLIIVTFDIPEIEKRKRDWLRWALKRLGLVMIQKSVWAGKTKIPKEFIDDLARLHLVEFVHIFEISRTGSLASLA